MTSRSPFAHRLIWITGASSGIGREVALQLAARGARLALSARREADLHDVAEQARAAGSPMVLVAPLDLTDVDSVKRAADAIMDEAGIPDIAVLAAGYWEPIKARRFSADAVERIFAVNVVGAARCIESILPGMLERGSGVIAPVASLTAFSALPLAAGYGASKSALVSMSESLRGELAGTGVTVTTINPGFVRTPMTDQNRFAMPMMMEVDAAAAIIVRGLERGAAEISFPRTMALGVKALGNAPGFIARPIRARMSRRPRG